LTPKEFVDMFIEMNPRYKKVKTTSKTPVHRIVYDYVDVEP